MCCTELSNLLHLGEPNEALTRGNVRMAVHARAAVAQAVIVVHEFEKARPSESCLQISLGVVTRGKDVTSIDADTEIG